MLTGSACIWWHGVWDPPSIVGPSRAFGVTGPQTDQKGVARSWGGGMVDKVGTHGNSGSAEIGLPCAMGPDTGFSDQATCCLWHSKGSFYISGQRQEGLQICVGREGWGCYSYQDLSPYLGLTWMSVLICPVPYL